ncbi:MAG: transcriptional regulator [Methanomicrobiales archaeon]|nr:transcriptional regulator [Methanomicrobiales archaeon]
MKVPCQTIVWDVLPAIRAAIAEEIVKNGVSQLEAARLLDMAPSAVSQYLTKKRGYRIELSAEVKVLIQQLAKDVKEGTVEDITPRICDICRHLRESGGEGPLDQKCIRSVSDGS